MTTWPRVLIVADDLTGAMDSAGPFAALGVETWVVAVPPDKAGGAPSLSLETARVVSVNTDSRHLSGAQAAQRIEAIARYIDFSAFDIVVKKVDSTLRGNVVAETLAMLAASGRRKALVAPAFPAQGRTMSNGVVHVDGKPLAQTAFAKDALSPPPLAPLQEVFGAARRDLRVAVVAPGAAFDEGADFWIADSVIDAHLSAAVSAMSTNASIRMQDVLLAGSAGLTQALARACFSGGVSSSALDRVNGTIVFAVGSRATRSAEQVDALALEPETAVLHAPNGRLQAGRLPAARNLVLKATADDAGREGDAEEVASDMAKHAIEIARQASAQALVATGGDTAIAILAASGNPALQVLGDLMPGIPYARIRIDGSSLWLVTKAGGFGHPLTFRDVARRLRGH
jgi:uncharacterized protein YgbK (DUF1537 family)